ncbi:MAG: rod shape-determining protein RodA [Bdellovibrionota bacterium]|jgi:rod shape determining protein RodA
MVIDRRFFYHFDWALFICIMLICVCGLTVLYSAGFNEDVSETLGWLPIETYSKPFLKQIFFWLIGLLIMLAAVSIPPKFLYKIAYPSYIVVLLLLVAVLLVGTWSHGARRWFDLEFAHFQPSELMKLSLILTMSRYLSKNLPEEGGYGLKQLFLPTLFTLIPMALIMAQPDLGTALVIAAIGFGMLLFVGIKLRTLILVGGVGIISVFPIWNFLLKEYQKRRVMTLIDPDADPLGSGYHIIQSKIAVGSGGLFGKGMLQGTQSQLEFLPEHTTDFIFSVLAEEWGFVGCLVVLTLFFFMLYRMLRIARHSKDLFSGLLVVGITILIAFHLFVNVGMVVGILPVVGIPLPLFSYGGSALLTNLFLLGLVFGVNIRKGHLFAS